MSPHDPPSAAAPLLVELGADDGGSSLLDLVDNLLDRGVVVHGDVVLGLAGVDLVYLRLSALLTAADRVLAPEVPETPEGER